LNRLFRRTTEDFSVGASEAEKGLILFRRNFMPIISFTSRSRKKNSLFLPEEEGALNKENIKTSKMMFLLILLHVFNHF